DACRDGVVEIDPIGSLLRTVQLRDRGRLKYRDVAFQRCATRGLRAGIVEPIDTVASRHEVRRQKPAPWIVVDVLGGSRVGLKPMTGYELRARCGKTFDLGATHKGHRQDHARKHPDYPH